MDKKAIIREWTEEGKRRYLSVNAEIDNFDNKIYISIRENFQLEDGEEDFVLLSQKDIVLSDIEKEIKAKFIRKWHNWCILNNYELEFL